MRVIHAVVVRCGANDDASGATAPTGCWARATLSHDAMASTSAPSHDGANKAPRSSVLATDASCLVTYAPPTASALVIANAKSTTGSVNPRLIVRCECRP